MGAAAKEADCHQGGSKPAQRDYELDAANKGGAAIAITHCEAAIATPIETPVEAYGRRGAREAEDGHGRTRQTV